jgi:hypothetical protein
MHGQINIKCSVLLRRKGEKKRIVIQRRCVDRVKNRSLFGNLNVVKWFWSCFLRGKDKGFQEVEAPGIYRQSEPESGKVINPTYQAPLTTRKYSWYSFLLEAESIPGPQCSRQDYVKEKLQ